MALSLLKRSDADIVLAATTDDPVGLAECLSAQQPFKVEVFATFAGLGFVLPAVQHSLRTLHMQNGWFAANAVEVARAICDAVGRPLNLSTTSDEPAAQNAGDADNSTSSEGEFNPAWHKLLAPCSREEAQRATVIRRALREKIGLWQAAALLNHYREVPLRCAGQSCQRFLVSCNGEVMRLVQAAL